MGLSPSPGFLPRSLLALVGVYFLATVAHFSHNAEYIAFYPGMPDWLDREKVYLAWTVMTSVGLALCVLLRCGFQSAALLLLALYGSLGLDSLTHYMLALCSEHTFGANLTIWSEAAAGLLVLLSSSVLFSRRLATARRQR